MKTFAVIIRAAETARVREALRACVGLGLRGDRVAILLENAAADRDPACARALNTLAVLGHAVYRDGAERERLVRDANAVEVWT